jgi:cysteinyl-tRNA synthetase
MNDDFNTPEAMAILFELANAANKEKSKTIAGLLKALGATLGLLQDDPVKRSQRGNYSITPESGHIATLGHASTVTVGMAGVEAKGEVGSVSADITGGLTGVSAKGEVGSISALIDERTAAKKSKNFAEADRIRKELLEAGIVLEDNAAGTTWRRA